MSIISVLENFRKSSGIFLSFSIFRGEAKRGKKLTKRGEARQHSRFCHEAKRSEVEVTRGEAKRFRKKSPRFGLCWGCITKNYSIWIVDSEEPLAHGECSNTGSRIVRGRVPALFRLYRFLESLLAVRWHTMHLDSRIFFITYIGRT